MIVVQILGKPIFNLMLLFTIVESLIHFKLVLNSKYSHGNDIVRKRILHVFDSLKEETYIKKIDLLYDSECPICAMEVDFLRKRDYENRIKFTDLSSPDYNASEHGNVTFEEGMRKIRAILPDKSVVTGVEVFRQTYRAIGLGWIFDLTNIPIIGKAADTLYDIWAENRLRLTGRHDLADVLKERSSALKDADIAECNADACDLDWEI